jgi:heme A synthase
MKTTSQISKIKNGLQIYAIITIGLLVIQYALGMVSNLFAQFPQTDQPDQLWAYARSYAPLFAHIVIGILLLVSAVIFVIRAARNKHRGWIESSAAGLIGILIAIYGGTAFVTAQVDTDSLIMALGFIVAFVAYCWGLYAARR